MSVLARRNVQCRCLQSLNFICKDGIEVIADFDAKIDNFKRLDVVLGHFLAGTNI